MTVNRSESQREVALGAPGQRERVGSRLKRCGLLGVGPAKVFIQNHELSINTKNFWTFTKTMFKNFLNCGKI